MELAINTMEQGTDAGVYSSILPGPDGTVDNWVRIALSDGRVVFRARERIGVFHLPREVTGYDAFVDSEPPIYKDLCLSNGWPASYALEVEVVQLSPEERSLPLFGIGIAPLGYAELSPACQVGWNSIHTDDGAVKHSFGYHCDDGGLFFSNCHDPGFSIYRLGTWSKPHHKAGVVYCCHTGNLCFFYQGELVHQVTCMSPDEFHNQNMMITISHNVRRLSEPLGCGIQLHLPSLDSSHAFLQSDEPEVASLQNKLDDLRRDFVSRVSISREDAVGILPAIRAKILGNLGDLLEMIQGALLSESVIDQPCLVCRNQSASVCFLPCQHFVCCDRCGYNFHECLLCRQTIDEIIAL